MRDFSFNSITSYLSAPEIRARPDSSRCIWSMEAMRRTVQIFPFIRGCLPVFPSIIFHSDDFVFTLHVLVFPALTITAFRIRIPLDPDSAGNFDSLSFLELVQAGNLLTFPGAYLKPAAVNYDSCRSFVSCFGAYGETSNSYVSNGGNLYHPDNPLNFNAI